MSEALKEVSRARLNEALDVAFDEARSDEEIEAWFDAQPDGDLLKAALFEGLYQEEPPPEVVNG